MSIDETINVWQEYLMSMAAWHTLIKDIEPKQTGCGPVYELTNPINRPHESFAIADMRNILFAEPHYHANGETEIYFVLQGNGLIVIGGEEQTLQKGSVVATLPNTAHFTIPHEELVLAVVNTPPFQAENYIVLSESNEQVKFDKNQFDKLIK